MVGGVVSGVDDGVGAVDCGSVVVLDEVTHADAADVLGVSEGTISWRMSEIRKRLKAMKEKPDP